MAGLTTGLVAPARPVRGTLFALALLPLPSLAMLFVENAHGGITLGHGVQLWAASQAVRFVAGMWVRQYHSMLLPGCTGAALAWMPVVGAQSYTLYRAGSDNPGFTVIGSGSGPSFGDSGLSAATPYTYRIATTISGGSQSPAVTAVTLPAPPRCDTPGTCPIDR